MTRFQVDVDIPFRRADVWKELAVTNGKTPHKPLGLPNGVITEMSTNTLELNGTRKVMMTNDDGTSGTVKYTLTRLVEGYSQTWQVDEQTNVPIRLKKPASTMLELSTLNDGSGLTRVTLSYEFAGISSPDTAVEDRLIEGLKRGMAGSVDLWTNDMIERGYTPTGGTAAAGTSAAGTGAAAAGTGAAATGTGAAAAATATAAATTVTAAAATERVPEAGGFDATRWVAYAELAR